MRFPFPVISGIVFLLAATVAGERSAAFQAAQVEPDQKVQAVPPEPRREHTGSVVGKVVDASQKAVSGATVVLKDLVTEDSSVSTSDKEGEYGFTKLFPGEYTVQAEKDGSRSDAARVKVNNGSVFRQDLVIKGNK